MAETILSANIPAEQVACPVQVAGQKVAYCGVGLCDPTMSNSVNALKVIRYQKFLVQWEIATAPGGGALAGDLVLTANQSIDLWNQGLGDAPGSLGFWISALTLAQTDAFNQGGSIGPRGQFFIGVGLMFQVLGVYQRGGTGSASNDPKYVNANLRQAQFAYTQPMAEATLRDFNGVITFGDSGCSYRFGLLMFYPSPNAIVDDSPRNGNIATPAAFTPFAVAICAGAKDSEKQVTVTLSNDTVATIIASNPVAPLATTAGSNEEATTVYQELIAQLLGCEMCLPDMSSCGPLSPNEQRMVGLGPISYAAPEVVAVQSPAGRRY